ncbi:YafY family protein [Pseudomonas sp. DTU_2021_1001937_2_SI_NGA_ILE_001]|uniref:helix-turn-helix transcriptional regulator n=1 Tax=Pseudomonas sp. DTU_2021_1001937_2_SI_NGA_ILE_001 TaxID=3077589 RepID=UPI0028FC285D|nr:YafY family protein [Pseudomonas sp. DTU_2021_1001937_2_SI_NGA_ILE_001]WNW13910.1 YafY family protein [Pseudomonas sp. DTU_2021_1001937_2_SI_NGA_ILE_001]
MRKADRLFQLVNLIRAHQPITAERLASRVGVSVRSIYRYIDDLSVSGIPIYGTTGVGYALDADFELPPLALNRLEWDALVLGVEMLAAAADAELGAAARALLGKISASVVRPPNPDSAAIRALGEMSGRTRLHLAALRKAIEQAQALTITYAHADGEVSRRLVYPLGLFYWGGKWTVGTWCEARGAYRDFRVDRIAAIIPAEQAFADNPAIDLRTYMRYQQDQWDSRVGTDSTLSV